MVIGFEFLSYVFLTTFCTCLFTGFCGCEISFVILPNFKSSVKIITKTGGKIKNFENLKKSVFDAVLQSRFDSFSFDRIRKCSTIYLVSVYCFY